MYAWLLGLDIASGPVPWIVWGATALLLVLLPLRRVTGRRVRRTIVAVAIGGILGAALCIAIDVLDVFGTPLPDAVPWWAAAGFAAVGFGVVHLWDSGVWRKIVAVLAIVGALLSTTLGVNIAFGLDRTLGDLLELSALPAAGALPTPLPSSTPTVDPPLYESWRPPADMPAHGEVRQLSGDQRIPSTAGFVPRDAAIYLPPAALVKNPPALPVIVQMMGLPGSPSPTAVQAAADAFAAQHEGLAPIVIVADQLGSSRQNPGCADSKTFGGVDTYFNVDIPQWIRTHLRALPGPAGWAISGYSNGGACSFLYGAQHPEIWNSLVSISGEEYPGMEDPTPVLTHVFGGDKAAFAANKPENVLAQHAGAYAGHFALFTAGADDKVYSPAAERAAASATAAGFETRFYSVPGAGHVGPALSGGLDEALRQLAPRWGLAP
ncbi:MAG: alpha/beta fold hydrolase [Microbacterium sp.]|nr:alpha/beta fold hydrolase [Microbacterium sp.]